MRHALTRVASRGGSRSVARLARSFAVARLLDRGRNVGRRSFAVARFLADPHRHFDAHWHFDANRNRDFDAHWHSDGDRHFDRHVDALYDRDRLGGFTSAALGYRGRRRSIFGLATATFFAAAFVAATIRAAVAGSVAVVAATPAAAVAAAVSAEVIAVAAVAPAVMTPAVMAPTMVTVAAVVAKAAVMITAVMVATMTVTVSPSRSLGGSESGDGKGGESSESEDGGTGFHGNLLWVDLKGSRVDRFGRRLFLPCILTTAALTDFPHGPSSGPREKEKARARDRSGFRGGT
jgi:hypothetical protein